VTTRISAAFIGRLLALALLLASSSATAEPDHADAPNIPAASPNPRASELPLPYTPWRGTGPLPPPADPIAGRPPPLARPRQLPRRPFELSAALSTFLPSCGSGSIDDRGCLTVSAGSGAELALLYRVSPFFAVGGEAALSGFGGRGHGLVSTASGAARFFGVIGRVYFADDGAWDPYLALTLGAGALSLREAGLSAGESTTGFGGRVAGGLDYRLGSHVRVGAAASFAHWLAWSESRCLDEVCRREPAVYGRLLGFATLGLRVTASFGEVL